MPRQPLQGARRAEQPSPVSNARLAILIVIAAEIMFFTGLVGAYIVFRGAAKAEVPVRAADARGGGSGSPTIARFTSTTAILSRFPVSRSSASDSS